MDIRRLARFTDEEMERGLAILSGGARLPPAPPLDERAKGYPTENLVPVTPDQASAMGSWAESIVWMTQAEGTR